MKKIATLLFSLVVFTPSLFSQYFSDDFESYTVNDFLAVASPVWTTWSNAPGGSEDVKIANNDAFSGTKSIYFNSPGGNGPNDVILPFGGVNSTGRFKFTSKFKVANGKAAYFNFQAGASPGITWAMEFYMRAGGTFDITSGGGVTGTYPQGVWFELSIDVDLDSDTWEVFIDNISQGKFTNTNSISFLDIFPADPNTEFWMDDVSYCINNACNAEIGLNSVTINPNPVCTHQPADVTVALKNNSTFSAPGMDLSIEIGPDKILQKVNLNNLAGGKDTTITIPGLFKSTIAGSNLPVTAINASGDLNAANDTAKTTISVNASPSETKITKGSPFTTPRPLTNGTSTDPDIVAAKDALTYGISAPKGYTNTGYSITWDIPSFTVRTKSGVVVPSTLYTFTPPVGASDGKITFSPDSTLTDSLIVITFSVVDKGTLCDSTLSRYIYVAPKPKVGYTAANVCDKEDVVFSNGSSISSGFINYEWTFGDGTGSNLTEPTKRYAAAGSYTVKLVVTSDYGYKDSATKVVDVFQIPVADFQFVNACEGTAITFDDKSSLPTGTPTFEWDFGTNPKSTATGASTSKLYSVPNSYNVTLKVTVNGCSSVASKFVTQEPRTSPDFSFTTGQCDNKDVVFTNLTNQPPFGSASYFWKYGDGVQSTEVSPKHTYNTFTTFNVTLISSTNFGCTDSIQKTVTLNQSPTASFTNTAADCNRSPIIFTNTSVVPSGSVNSYEWDFGDGDSDLAENPTHQYANAGTYTVTMKAKSSNGCTSETQTIFTVLVKPIAAFGAKDVCQGEELKLGNISVSPDNSPLTYKWMFGNGDSSSLISPTITYNTVGVYNITLETENGNGCIDEETISINVFETPVVSILSSSANTGNGGIKFATNTTGTGYKYFWLFGDGASSTQQNPDYRYFDDGLKFVKLKVTTPNGCSGTATDTVNVNVLGVNNVNDVSVNVYPNPSAGKFIVDLSAVNSNDIKAINVTDMLGRILVNNIITTTNGTAEIDLATQAAGIYYLNIYTNNGLQTVKLTVTQ